MPPAPRVQAQDSGWGALQPCWARGSHQPRAPDSHRFSVLRNLLPGWKRCLRLLETECFLLWGWFLQGSVGQRAEDDTAGGEELMPTLGEGSAEVSTARAVSLPCSSMAQTDPAPPQPCGSHHSPAGLCCPLTPIPSFPVLWAHRGKCSAGGQSSPGPADGPELRPVPSAVGRGRRTPASLWGQSSITPLPGGKGVPIPPPTSSGCPPARQQLWVLGPSGCAGTSLVLCHSSQEHPALHSAL